MINASAFGPPTPGYRRSTSGGLRGLLSSQRPSLEEDSGTRERFVPDPLVYEYQPLMPRTSSSPGFESANDAVASTATPELPSAALLGRRDQNAQTSAINSLGALSRSQPDEFQDGLQMAQTLVRGLKLGADAPGMLTGSGAFGPGSLGGDVSAGLGGAGGLLGLLASLSDSDRADVSRALGGAQGLASLAQGASRLSAVQGAAPGLASSVGGAAGLAGGALGLASGAYGLSQGDPGGMLGLASGGLTLAGAAGAFPAAASAIAASGAAGGGSLAGMGAGASAAGPAMAAFAPVAIGLLLQSLIFGPEQQKRKEEKIKHNLGEINRTREMVTGMSEVFRSTPFAQAVHMRAPGEDGATIGDVLRAIAERNISGTLAGRNLWEPDAKYGALIAALDEAGIPKGRYDGAKAEHLVDYAMPGKSNYYDAKDQGGTLWGPILTALSDHVLQRDPTLAQRGPKPPPREQWIESVLRLTAGKESNQQGRSLADILWALDPAAAEGGDDGRLHLDPRMAKWWDETAKRTKYKPSASNLASLAKYRSDLQSASGDGGGAGAGGGDW